MDEALERAIETNKANWAKLRADLRETFDYLHRRLDEIEPAVYRTAANLAAAEERLNAAMARWDAEDQEARS